MQVAGQVAATRTAWQCSGQEPPEVVVAFAVVDETETATAELTVLAVVLDVVAVDGVPEDEVPDEAAAVALGAAATVVDAETTVGDDVATVAAAPVAAARP